MPGATLITGALMLAVYTIVKASDYGWGSAHTLGLGALAVALGVGFVVREQRAGHPAHPAGHLPLARRDRGQPRRRC